MATKTAVTQRGPADVLAICCLVVAAYIGWDPVGVHLFLVSCLCTIRRFLLV